MDLSRCRLKPFDHQVAGVERILANNYFLLGDEMGAGKTKQAIDAACILRARGEIDKVLIIAPATVRDVWFDEELGELAKHLWSDLSCMIIEYHKRGRVWAHGSPFVKPFMEWGVTNYEYIDDWKDDYGPYAELEEWCDKRTFLILDETSSIKNMSAKRTKAAARLRWKCGRVLLLNGTPITNSPGDMLAQGKIMHPSILNCPYKAQFNARYANFGGFEGRKVVSWRNLDDLQERFKPFVLRRLKKDCLDLPEKMPPVVMQPALSTTTWNIYRQMRDQLIAWVSQQHVSVAPQVVTKILRLAQITSGFLGGVEEEPDGDWLFDDDNTPSYLAKEPSRQMDLLTVVDKSVTFSREKLDHFLDWYANAIYQRPNLKMIVWCRFKPELYRVLEEVAKIYPHVTMAAMHGGQKKSDRRRTLKLLDPRHTVAGPVLAGATLGTGSVGLTLTAADTNYYMSLNHSLMHLLQSAERTYRPTQVNPVSYYYSLATGPKGQKTIDHVIFKALQDHQALAEWTCKAWEVALKEVA